jgi:hypothetical protein
MTRARIYTAIVAGLALCLANAAQADDKEPIAVVGIGAQGEWGVPGATSIGPSVSVEFDVIKDWLEVEVGTARMFSRGGRSWDSDLVFKKPFTLSKTVEFMIGAGPALSYSRDGGSKWGATAALDFMIWPLPERRFGWFVEPSYTDLKGGDKSLAVSVGLLVSIY